MFKALLASLLIACPAGATSISFTAAIDGAQVVSPTGSLAFGTGVFSLDEITHLLNLSIVQTGVLLAGAETRAQLHVGAAGTNGPAVADIPMGDTKLAVLDLSLLAACGVVTQCEADLKAGLWYVLTSSTAFADGEIRGQINPAVVVPEAAGWLMLAMGLAGLGIVGVRPA